jgi:F0F1-type ATP synthase assembly protein I
MRKRVFIVQALLITVAMALAIWVSGLESALAVLYGGAMVMINTAVQQWGHFRASKIAGTDLGRNMRIIYRTAAQRFIVTLALFAVGIGVLKLEPKSMIAGFIWLQLAQVLDWFIESRLRKHHVKRRDPYLW